jgi:hypothetical protein
VKIGFLSHDGDLSVGSYRIWCCDLSKYLCEAGYNSTVFEQIETFNYISNYGVIEGHIKKDAIKKITECDVIILSKNSTLFLEDIKRFSKDSLVGVINYAADAPPLPFDFYIVGSLEEMASMSKYDNVFYYPLIENMYQSPSLYKKHEKKEELTIGFHGSYSHISKLGFQNSAILSALKDFSQEQKITLKIVTNPQTQIPEIKSIPNWKTVVVPWKIETVAEELLGCDIGIVPNVGYLPLESLRNQEININKGFYSSDYLMRFKNKSNAGRSFVFHQLGIPVISDLTPSNFHVMGSGECGHIVSNQTGWLKSFQYFKDHTTRQQVADRAKNEFDRIYNPHDWAKKLYNQIKGIKNEN